MALRLIEISLPPDEQFNPEEIFDEEPIIDQWRESTSGDRSLIKILISADKSETVLDALTQRFSDIPDFRVVLLEVRATIPRQDDGEDPESEQRDNVEQSEKSRDRIAREEIYNEVADTAKLSSVYLIMVLLSASVAAVGILRNDVAIVIGSMVIAPLLGPNIALSLATTLADFKLGRKALQTSAAGIGLAFASSFLIGLIVTVNPDLPQISSRVQPNFGDIGLSLAAGGAGALAFTTGISSAFVGVMVAVALLPPLVIVGMLLGAGFYAQALGAGLLLLTNIICINLAGVLTFLIQDIRPVKWWEAKKAGVATRNAIILWIVLLLILAVIIFLKPAQNI
jgi:uncharacterized hydrophobic protein (TIGR00341 family)